MKVVYEFGIVVLGYVYDHSSHRSYTRPSVKSKKGQIMVFKKENRFFSALLVY